jgi:hypothetical protein
MFETCPTDIVDAPAETVWRLVSDPKLLDWVDARLVEHPGRPAQTGDRLRFKANGVFEVRWVVGAVEPPQTLALHIELPFGLVNEEVIRISPMGEMRCRVTLQ